MQLEQFKIKKKMEEGIKRCVGTQAVVESNLF